MTNDTLPHLLAAIQQSEDGDFLRVLAETKLNRLMDSDGENAIGAGRHERSPDRLTYRNGYRDRVLETRVGAVLMEANDEWQLQHHYLSVQALAEVAAGDDSDNSTLRRPPPRRYLLRARPDAITPPVAPNFHHSGGRHRPEPREPHTSGATGVLPSSATARPRAFYSAPNLPAGLHNPNLQQMRCLSWP